MISFYLGFLLVGPFYDSDIIPKIDGIDYAVTSIRGPALLFSSVLGLFPILLSVTWRLSLVTAANKKLGSALLAVVCIIIAVLGRRQIIKWKLEELKTYNLHINYPFDELYFEYFMLVGLIIGCIISYFIFRQGKHLTQSASR